MSLKNGYRKTAVIMLVILIMIAAGLLFLRLSGIAFTVRSVSKYEQYFGANGEYRENRQTQNGIFPERLPSSAKMEKFVYRHEDLMDPSDAAILIYTWSKEDYEVETRQKFFAFL